MNHRHLLALLLAQLFVSHLQAWTCGEVYSITEILNHRTENVHVFTCRVQATYQGKMGFESVAVVEEVFRGQPKDTVYVSSGGLGFGPGEKMVPGTAWLIFSKSRDSLHYSATICDDASSLLFAPDTCSCYKYQFPHGEDFLRIVREYRDIENSRYTGPKSFFAKGVLIAEGYFQNGWPKGEWRHFRPIQTQNKRGKLKSRIHYDSGKWDGLYLKYSLSGEEPVETWRAYYEQDRLKWVENAGGRTLVSYLPSGDRRELYVRLSEQGDTLEMHTRYIKDDEKSYGFALTYWHGLYLKKDFSREDRDELWAEGEYRQGARVGRWVFYDKGGKVKKEVVYPEPPADTSFFRIYNDTGVVLVEGRYEQGKRVGQWRFSPKNKISRIHLYSSTGEKLIEFIFGPKGRMLSQTAFRHGRKQGLETAFCPSGKVSAITHYRNGLRHGPHIRYSPAGEVLYESTFRNGRETSLKKESPADPALVDGYRHGPFVQFDSGTKVLEGQYWMGYPVGVWAESYPDGRTKQMRYPSDPQKLMTACREIIPEILHN